MNFDTWLSFIVECHACACMGPYRNAWHKLVTCKYSLYNIKFRPLAGYGLPPPKGEFCRPYFP